MGTSKSFSRKPSQVSSAAVAAKALYLASVLDPETVFCLREHQDMRLDPMNVAYPMVDLLVKGHPAQPLSEKH